MNLDKVTWLGVYTVFTSMLGLCIRNPHVETCWLSPIAHQQMRIPTHLLHAISLRIVVLMQYIQVYFHRGKIPTKEFYIKNIRYCNIIVVIQVIEEGMIIHILKINGAKVLLSKEIGLK